MDETEDELIDRLRRRLCCRLARKVKDSMEFPDDGACIRWVVPALCMFDKDWLERFFPAFGPPLRGEALPPVQEPRGKIRGKTFQGWWDHLTPQILAWGWLQPWGQHGDGVEGLLGEAYVQAVELWHVSKKESFALPGGSKEGETKWTDSALDWMRAIVHGVAAQRTKTREVALAFDPEYRRVERLADDATRTSDSDRRVMARRVERLSGSLPHPVPRLEERLGGRGTLELVLVADQLEIALALDPDDRRDWCLQTLAGIASPDLARERDARPNTIHVRFGRIRDRAQSNLAALWCQYLPAVAPAPTPEGTTHE